MVKMERLVKENRFKVTVGKADLINLKHRFILKYRHLFSFIGLLVRTTLNQYTKPLMCRHVA